MDIDLSEGQPHIPYLRKTNVLNHFKELLNLYEKRT